MSSDQGGAGKGNAGVTAQAVEQWMVANLAQRLKVDPTEVDIKRPFSQFGLDSQEGVALQGDLERWLGRELMPTLIWDYPTIEQVARHVTGQ